MRLFHVLGLLIFTILAAGCASRHVAAPAAREAESVIAKQAASSGCTDDPAAYLQKNIWNAKRLDIIEPCITITGVVTAVRPILDGDLHVHLRPDPHFSGLVNEKNIQARGGNLIMEPQCRWAMWRRGSTGSCSNRGFRLEIPKVGTRVRVTGTFVFDRDHGWNELHPVFKLDILP